MTADALRAIEGAAADMGDAPRGAWACLRERTRTEWLDINRHVNVRHFLHMASEAAGNLMDASLRPPDQRGAPASFFTFEARMFYKRELKENQDIAAYVHPLSHDGTRLKALIRIERTDPDPVEAAVCEWTGAFMDAATGAPLPLPAFAIEQIEAKMAEGRIAYERRPYVPFLTMPDNERAPLHTVDSTIKEDWAGRGGLMDFASFPYMFFRAFHAPQFQAIGLEFNDLRKEGFTMFVLECSVECFETLSVGQPYRMESRLESIGRKTLTMRHDVFATEPKPRLAAQGWFTRAIVDYDTRKTVFIPAAMRDALSRAYGVAIADPGV